MPKSFTEIEKDNIRNKLMDACKKSWTQFGYKKTSVDDMCKQVSISKGAFYIFFDSKEALFCDVLCSVQEHIRSIALQVIEERKGKKGIAEAIKLVYREYDKNNFLYNSNSADFITFTNKLSEEQLQRIQNSSYQSSRLFIDHPSFRLKVDAEKAVSVIYSLIMNIRVKEFLPCNHIEVFDFMVDHLVDDLYE